MTPTIPQADHADVARVHAILSGKFSPTQRGISDCQYLRLRQAVAAMLLAGLTMCSAFSDFISDVVGRSAEKEMIGSDAWWVIAVMTDVHSVGDRTVVYLPRQSVSTDQPSVAGHVSVAMTSTPAYPNPTIDRAIDPSPEAVLNRSMVTAWLAVPLLLEAVALNQNRLFATEACERYEHRPNICHARTCCNDRRPL